MGKRHVYKHLHQPIYQLCFCFNDHFTNHHGDLNQSYHRAVNRRPIKSLEFFYIVGIVNTDWKVLWIQSNFFPQWRQLPFAYKRLFSTVRSHSVRFLNMTFLKWKIFFIIFVETYFERRFCCKELPWIFLLKNTRFQKMDLWEPKI